MLYCLNGSMYFVTSMVLGKRSEFEHIISPRNYAVNASSSPMASLNCYGCNPSLCCGHHNKAIGCRSVTVFNRIT